MNRRSLILSCGVLVLINLGLAFYAFSPREPQYQGRTLREWLGAGARPGPAGERFPAAITAMGTNAIPGLVDVLRTKDSRMRQVLTEWVSRLGIAEGLTLPRGSRRMMAAYAFDILGPAAKGAIPSLKAILQDPETADTAAMALAGIGPDALPALMAALAQQNPRIRYAAAREVGGLGPSAKPAVPLLLACARAGDYRVREAASVSLGLIGDASTDVVAALSQNLSCGDASVRRAAAESLGVFGAAAKGAVPALLMALRDSDLAVHDEVAAALRKIDPDTAAKAGPK